MQGCRGAMSFYYFFRLHRFPQFVCHRRPLFRIGHTFGAEFVRRFGSQKVRGFGAAAFDHFCQGRRIFQHGAGTEVVTVEGLSFGVFFEERLGEASEQVVSLDIGAGVWMNTQGSTSPLGLIWQ